MHPIIHPPTLKLSFTPSIHRLLTPMTIFDSEIEDEDDEDEDVVDDRDSDETDEDEADEDDEEYGDINGGAGIAGVHMQPSAARLTSPADG